MCFVQESSILISDIAMSLSDSMKRMVHSITVQPEILLGTLCILADWQFWAQSAGISNRLIVYSIMLSLNNSYYMEFSIVRAVYEVILPPKNFKHQM